MSASDRLDADQIRAALGSAIIGREVTILQQTSSTNDEIAELAKAGHPEGAVVFAEHQTAGRGQRGNTWESAANKGLWLSILLRPEIRVQDSGMLTSWAARTVATTIDQFCQIETRVKPPNDVYIVDRKVAGVLVEMKAQPESAHIAILGVGINVNQVRSDFPEPLQGRATSLLLATGHACDRTALAAALLGNFDRTYRNLAGTQSAQRL
ncbi:MAG TPA: biotin--[acetyl-CoA-carboxylase] ligase [Chthoniobacterales bacterium]|nr:biotin--[acetyl-CoA-carboxylase] ligase [Chthoniobacterales bacterium]